MQQTRTQRNHTLDLLRGIAVLGILLLNIYAFAWPEVALYNPTIWVTEGSVDFLIWSLTHLFAEQKFYSLLSLMFGASLLLFDQSANQKGLDPNSAHRRRMVVLGVMGLLHAYLLWFGDILYFYAICGALAWLLRHRRARTLWVAGVVLMAVPSVLLLVMQAVVNSLSPEDLVEWEAILSPDVDVINQEIAAYQGSWWQQMSERVPAAADSQWAGFLSMGLWKTLALMLWGMALLKQHWFDPSLADSRHQQMAIVIALPLGLGLTGVGLWLNVTNNFELQTTLFAGQQWNYWGSVLTALGYSALLVKYWGHAPTAGVLMAGLRRRLIAVGRLALSCYIAQTLIATTLFYGHGLGWFGQLSASALMLIVVIIWLILLEGAPRYQSRFGIGPLEWLWRRVSYSH